MSLLIIDNAERQSAEVSSLDGFAVRTYQYEGAKHLLIAKSGLQRLEYYQVNNACIEVL